MARFVEPTQKQLAGWAKWVRSRPLSVRRVAEKLEPWSLYRLKDTGQRCTVYSFSEDGTVTVNITGDFNVTLFDRQVFGIDPDMLEPCDLPAEDEPVGVILSEDQSVDYISGVRAINGLPPLSPSGEARAATAKALGKGAA